MILGATWLPVFRRCYTEVVSCELARGARDGWRGMAQDISLCNNTEITVKVYGVNAARSCEYTCAVRNLLNAQCMRAGGARQGVHSSTTEPFEPKYDAVHDAMDVL